MIAADFLTSILAEAGHYCLFASKKNTERDLPKEEQSLPKQYFYTSPEKLVDAAVKLDHAGYDAYFALATFKNTDSRKVENVNKLRSFFLDLDCGPSKSYPDKAAAIAALRVFCSTLSLPIPTMVDSGRGVHAYWPVSDPLSLEEWLPVAEQLKKLCAENGLLADPAVTSDAARVLRIPNTHNHKDEVPSTVECLGDVTPEIDPDWFAGLLKVDTVGTPTVADTGPRSNAKIEHERSNRESHFKDILSKTNVGVGCEQLKYIVVSQADIDEPLWRAGLSIAKFCVESEKTARNISKKHPRYSEQETLEKMDAIQGPYTCDRFEELNPGLCAGCPNNGKVKSPIVLGSRVKECENSSPFGTFTGANAFVSTPTPSEDTEDLPELTGAVGNNILATMIVPKYPFPYFRGANGGVYLRTKDADGLIDEKCVYHNDFYVVKRVFDGSGAGESVLIRFHMPQDGVREFVLPLSTITSPEEFRKAVSKQGVVTLDMRSLMSYTMSWITELQSASKAANARIQFGWADDHKMDEFILGDRAIFADRVEQNPPSEATVALFPAFEPAGTLDAWKEAMEFWNRPEFEPYQYVVGMGFGSVLMPYTTVNCAAMHLYSKDSGVAKTTAMVAACGIWGNPEDLILGQDDTANSVYNRAEVYHNLPWCIDEITNIPPKAASDLVYAFTGGKQKNRMSKSANQERVRGRPWNLMACTTGNASLVSRVSAAKAMPKAEAQRVLECRLPDLRAHFSGKQETDDFDLAVHNNYGWAGEEFVRFVMNNPDLVQKTLADVKAKVEKEGGLSAPDRFWSAHITASLSGIILAKKAGLINYDVKAVYQWALRDLLKINKENTVALSAKPGEILSDYMAESRADILIVSSSVRVGMSMLPEQTPRGELKGRYEPNTHILALMVNPLRQWCVSKQLDYEELLSSLLVEFPGSVVKNTRVDKGTNIGLPGPVRCLVIPEIAGIANKEDDDPDVAGE